ncbi:MAG: hypothetical protein ABI718_18740 [Acidobacteriota bacterium]
MRAIPRIERVNGRLKAPPSAACTLTSIVLASMSDGPTTIHGSLDMDESRYLVDALRRIGVEVAGTFRDGLTIGDRVGISANDVELDIADASGAIPYLIGMLTFTPGHFLLKGRDQSRDWSAVLVEPLRNLGAEIDYRGEEGRLPMQIRGKVTRGGMEIAVDHTISGEFLSAIMMGVPRMRGGVDLVLHQPLPPSSRLTQRLLEEFGGIAENADSNTLKISAPAMTRKNYMVEGDFSAGAYWLALAAAAGGELSVEGLPVDSAQPEAAIVGILERLGVSLTVSEGTVALSAAGHPQGGRIDCASSPGLVPILAAVAPSFAGPLTLAGLTDLVAREPQLIKALQSALETLGVTSSLSGDQFTVQPGWDASPATIDPGGDPRLVMAFALAGLLRGSVSVEDEQAVAHTYPRFWRTLDEIVSSSAALHSTGLTP